MAIALPLPSRFEERRFLGRGGAGEVFLVWDHQHQKEVALKMVRSLDHDLLLAEENGAQLQKELAHTAPQIPQIYDIIADRHALFIVMEYVAGQDLTHLLRQGPLAEDRAIRIAIQLCEFLNRLHNHAAEIRGRKILGIVHGDIKPDNIRILEDDQIRILDFGIAKQLSLSRSFTTNLFGSLPYSPPDQLKSGKLDPLSDLWATGIVLYLMVCGRLPFAGTTPEEVRLRLLRGEVLPLPNSCSRPLRWVILKNLSLEPERRYPTAAALQADLVEVRDGQFENRKFTDPASVITQPTTPPYTSPSQSSQATRRSTISLDLLRSVPTPSRRIIFTFASLLILALTVTSQVYTWKEATTLRQRLLLGDEPQVALLFEDYKRIRRLTLFDLGLSDLRQEITQALKETAEQTLTRYREEDSGTNREEWQEAYQHFAHVLELDNRDIESRARLAYCQGRVSLIDAISLKEAGDAEAARTSQSKAVVAFEKAADLDPRWPDPYMSLARIYADEQFDQGKLEQSLEQAERRGYTDHQQLTTLRADGHLKEGRRLYSESLKIRGREGEEEILLRSLMHFYKAIELSRQVADLARPKRTQANAAWQMRLVKNRLVIIQD